MSDRATEREEVSRIVCALEDACASIAGVRVGASGNVQRDVSIAITHMETAALFLERAGLRLARE